MRSLLSAIGAAACGSSLVACAVPAPDPEPEASSGPATAVVVIERTAGPGDAVRGDAVVARFVRVKQGTVDEPALRIAGAALDVPIPGTCFAPAEGAPLIQGRAVELLDVGQVVMSAEADEGADGNIVLLPRTMPNPAGVVSGVFYSSRSSDVFVQGSPLSIQASGGPDLAEGFSVHVTAPREINEIEGSFGAAGLEVSWDVADLDSQDLVYVDVLSPAPHVVVRCSGPDDGQILVPHVWLSGVEEGHIAVHRLRKESFKAKGIDPGEVHFDVAKVITFQR